MPINVLRGVAGVAFALGLGLLVYGFGFSGDGDDSPPAAAEPTATSAATETPTPEPSSTSTRTNTSTTEPSPTETEIPTPTPTPFDGGLASMRIPRFDVDAAIENIGISDQNQLEVPDEPENVGWYGIYADRDRRPGGDYQKPGWGFNSLFSAHVDYWPDIQGPFYNLADIELGDEIYVVMEDGKEYGYRVIKNQRWTVEKIPTGDLIKADDRPEGDEWITLITCGGDFVPYNGYDGPGYYRHRDVVIAERFQ